MAKKVSTIMGDTVVKLVFANGDEVRVDMNDLDAAMVHRLALHGLKQKLADSVAGKLGNLSEAVAECQAVADALLGGDWTRKGGGDGGNLALAVAEVTGAGLDEVRETLAKVDEDVKKTLRKEPRIAAVLARMTAEAKEKLAKEATGGMDLGSLFGKGLGDSEDDEE